MDLRELWLACRTGDLYRVQYLVEQKDVDLNVRDKWDSSPLYYACLCGHEELVKYMLQNGARCEANTFDGERCLYGALNDSIKKLLKSYKQITSTTMRRDIYNEFLRRAFERGNYSDIKFVVQGEAILAHKCVLVARSEYFMDMFSTKWKERDTIQLSNKLVLPWAFRLILGYFYTGQMEVHIDHVNAIIMLAKQCRLHGLIEQLEERMKKVISFESQKPGVNITVISLSDGTDDDTDLKNELGFLADNCLPKQLNKLEELPFAPEKIDTYADVIFNVCGRLFYCHKLFFCARSDYFKAVVADHFGETSQYIDGLPVIILHDVTVQVFLQILYYLYQDSCPELNLQNVYDVLVAADMYLLPGLKRLCANAIAQHLETENVTSILRMAEMFNLPRLEDQCKGFMASNIDKMIQMREFADFVKEDAKQVKDRQETDTIPIIDDIRYHITNFVQTFSDMYEADQKLSLIDSFLEELELDA